MKAGSAAKLIVDALLQRFLPLARRRIETAQAHELNVSRPELLGWIISRDLLMFPTTDDINIGKGKRPGKGGNRFWKSVGLGFKTPREAIEGPPKTLASL
ncbi:hypothetical protein CTI12_AA519690 [Artemisia annua]|uniref:Small ribosomal subunit protein uS17 N-terminal domain-containing protein n=1 Tax=Artemisia annua TaxID=35608 RepID=A0A2U1L850_ARTAN|nr:hypothetical protein CTI12_AA519690 [Artemisia annua]